MQFIIIFLKTGRSISLYWKCQFIFWSVIALQWVYTGYMGTNFSWLMALVYFAGDLLIYILPSHLYRNLSKKMGWHKLRVQQLLLRVVPAIFILGFIFMLLTIGKNHLVRVWLQDDYSGTFSASLHSNFFITFITGIRIMAIWLLAYYGYHYAQREINAVKEAGRLQVMAKDAAFNNLTAQLNPHFFFNALNSIKALVVENPKAARRAIDILSDMLRSSLYAKEETLVSLKEEMALVNDYLALEKIRFEEKLNIIIDTDELLMDKQVLRFSIQLLVENAIKHGISKNRHGGYIKVGAQQCEGSLVLSVKNSGRFEPELQKGIGLKNLTERLQLQFGDTASLQLEDLPDETVLATIKIPLA